MNHLDKSLKDIMRNIESSRCGHSDEDDNAKALMAKFKLTTKSGGAFLLG